MKNCVEYHAITRDPRWPDQVVVVRVIRENGKFVSERNVAWHRNENLALTDMHHRNADLWAK